MKCVIPSPNVKIIARAVHSLAKIGDEMFVQPSADELVLRTINMAKSAFAEFRMCRSFFSYFSYNDPQDNDSKCKVTMKSCLSVFKGTHGLDKQVENCEIRLKSDCTLVVFQLKFTNASVKKYYLPVIESDILEAQIPAGAPNQLAASSKFLSASIKNFRHSEDEITLAVSSDKTVIKNHLELRRDVNLMRTELCFHQNEFESYVVGNPTDVTFCLKELRAVVSFAEPANLPVIISFTQPGRPIVFQVLNLPAYEANYVVSTLNSSESDTSRLSVTRTTASTPQPTEVRRNTTNPQESFAFGEAEEHSLSKNLSSTKITLDPSVKNKNIASEDPTENIETVSNRSLLEPNNGNLYHTSPYKRKSENSCESLLVKKRNMSSAEPPVVEPVPSTSTYDHNNSKRPHVNNGEHGTPKISFDILPREPPETETEREEEGNGDKQYSRVIPESEPSDSFHVLPGPSSAPDVVFKRPPSRQESQSSQPPPELLKTIFSRCFSKDHFLDALVGQDVVLDEGSDREVV